MVAFQNAPGMAAGFNPASAENLQKMLDAPCDEVLIWDTGELSGFATVKLEPYRHFYAEIRKFGVYPAGQGIGDQFARALLSELFVKRGFFRAEVACYGDNPAAARFYERLGFAREGLLRQAVRQRSGTRVDLILLAMTHNDWNLAETRRAS